MDPRIMQMGSLIKEGGALAHIVKCDNGYIVSFVEPPKPIKEPRRKKGEAEPEEVSAEEQVDRMIDGMIGLTRQLNAASEGEKWKGHPEDADVDRSKMREGFKVMFPGPYRSMIHALRQNMAPCEPRIESVVFESKEALLKYLSKNL